MLAAVISSGVTYVYVYTKGRRSERRHEGEGREGRPLTAGRVAPQVLPLFCFDPLQWGRAPGGAPRVGHFRAAFLLQSLAALRDGLREIGSDLLACKCAPAQALSGAAAAALQPWVQSPTGLQVADPPLNIVLATISGTNQDGLHPLQFLCARAIRGKVGSGASLQEQCCRRRAQLRVGRRAAGAPQHGTPNNSHDAAGDHQGGACCRR